MLIVFQDRLQVVEFDKVDSMYINENNNLAAETDQYEFTLGGFENETRAREVIADFVKAYHRGDAVWQVPDE